MYPIILNNNNDRNGDRKAALVCCASPDFLTFREKDGLQRGRNILEQQYIIIYEHNSSDVIGGGVVHSSTRRRRQKRMTSCSHGRVDNEPARDSYYNNATDWQLSLQYEKL